ncbi:2501_t:CDS:2 [Funneliformis geosporum]|uniref:2501_t:CDS:1 n=1 Tax=Funneliformis geosporum TaxID=1117311 RepID=A0A9W4WST0_9GLOM|nr:2501_t:CDS:2 [Funneliformis geosporum]
MIISDYTKTIVPKKARRIEGTNSFFDLGGDDRVLKYDKEELLRILEDNHYHFS